MNTLMILLFGLAIGAVARWLVPGQQPGRWLVASTIGLFGSVLGALVGNAIGAPANSAASSFAASVVGALLVVVAYQVVTKHRHLTH